MKRRIGLLLSLIVMVMFCQVVSAEDWKPKKAVTLVVPYGAGGGTDLSARTFAKHLQKRFKKPVIVTNINGAGGYTGSKQVYDAKPDGYKILYMHASVVTNYTTGTAPYSYDGFEAGIQLCDDASTAVVTRPGTGIKTAKELIDYAKKHPGKLKAACSFGGTTEYFWKKLERDFDIDLDIIDIGGGSQRVPSLLGGHIDLIPSLYNSSKPYIDSGDFVAIGIPQEERQKNAPTIPTFKEQGVDFVVPSYHFTIFFPKGTPKNVVDTYAKYAEEVVNDPEYQKDVIKIGFVPGFTGPEETAKIFADLQKTYEELSK